MLHVQVIEVPSLQVLDVNLLVTECLEVLQCRRSRRRCQAMVVVAWRFPLDDEEVVSLCVSSSVLLFFGSGGLMMEL